ncbi:hypothetical protein ACFWMR_28920 [Amycolatopsis thailandensis]|uniref:hypothetical protein n=1 Tax=Amycolatopsis thailandensis TaxID=589330 RepID=UPI00365CF4CD
MWLQEIVKALGLLVAFGGLAIGVEHLSQCAQFHGYQVRSEEKSKYFISVGVVDYVMGNHVYGQQATCASSGLSY